MSFVLVSRERVTYVRGFPHCSVREGDPERRGLLRLGRWVRCRHLHFWIARKGAGITHYVGSVPVCSTGIDRSRLRKTLSRLSRLAPREDQPVLRAGLRDALRRESA